MVDFTMAAQPAANGGVGLPARFIDVLGGDDAALAQRHDCRPFSTSCKSAAE
jgi:hypothetical protein